jgi:hypothetical protein
VTLSCARSSLGLVAVEGHRDTARKFWNRVPEVRGPFGAELSRRRRARSGNICRLYEFRDLWVECGEVVCVLVPERRLGVAGSGGGDGGGGGGGVRWPD